MISSSSNESVLAPDESERKRIVTAQEEIMQHLGPSGSSGGLRNKQLAQACVFVSETWLPVDPSLLKNIKSRIATGHYSENRDLLILDLKKDFSLFMYCIKKLSELVRLKSDPLVEWVTPSQLINGCSLEEIKQVLDASSGIISRHRLDQATDFQSKRLAASITSATVAEAMAIPDGLDSEYAFSCAMFRQLGLTLIAWNYPNVYKRVLSSVSETESIDRALSKMLGFSPTLLGLTIAKSWSIAPEVRAVMGEEKAKAELNPKQLELVGAFEKICKVGEVFAQATYTSNGSQRMNDWREASEQIKLQLGQAGFDLLQKQIKDNLESYTKLAPEILKVAPQDPEEIEESNSDSNLGIATQSGVIRKNRYVRSCSQEIQNRFTELYASVDGKTIQKEHIDLLVNKIIRPSGFMHGCIYLLEPDSLMLVPRLVIGDKPKSDYTSVNYTSLSHGGNPVAAAFRSTVPVIQEDDPEVTPYIAGVLGNSVKAGVLYLEMSPELLSDPNSNPLVSFKAIRAALNDAMHL